MTADRRARRYGAAGTFTRAEVKRIRSAQNGKCANPWCKHPGAKLGIDHIVALSKGGSNDRTNIQLLCGPCNTSKGRRNNEEWLLLQSLLFSAASAGENPPGQRLSKAFQRS
jgi:5-methylcytosine-specific restriction endonuclease McrA